MRSALGRAGGRAQPMIPVLPHIRTRSGPPGWWRVSRTSPADAQIVRHPLEARWAPYIFSRMAGSLDSFKTRGTLDVAGTRFAIQRLDALGARVARLPISLKVLLENVLRLEDGRTTTRAHVEAILDWQPAAPPSREIPFMPARVLLQDFTGVPAVVDLAAMRQAMRRMGGDPARINPLQPADLVIDHSVQVDQFGTPGAFA